MPKRKTCEGCGVPIGPHEIRIVIPERCDKDVGRVGVFHRDCGILEELIQDGILFEENVTRLFALFQEVLKDWCDPEPAQEWMLHQINSQVLKLNREIYGTDLQELRSFKVTVAQLKTFLKLAEGMADHEEMTLTVKSEPIDLSAVCGLSTGEAEPSPDKEVPMN